MRDQYELRFVCTVEAPFEFVKLLAEEGFFGAKGVKGGFVCE